MLGIVPHKPETQPLVPTLLWEWSWLAGTITAECCEHLNLKKDLAGDSAAARLDGKDLVHKGSLAADWLSLK